MKANPNGRHISFWTATSFIVASMIGTGVFTSLGFQLIEIKSIFPLLMLWVTGGIVALAGALTYAELGTAFPRSGGEYNLLSRIIHPSIGFSAGVVSSTIGFTAPAVLAAMALGNYLSAIIPFINPNFIAFIIIVIIHYLHMSSIRWGMIFQDYSTLIKIGLIFIFIAFGLTTNRLESLSIMPVSGDAQIIMSSSFAISLVWVSYAYTGWNSSIYISGELINPKINISKVMIYATIFVMILYVLLNYVFLYTTPIESMVGQIDIGYLAGVQVFGDIGGMIMGLSISILLLSTVSSYIYIGPRIMQIMGEDHLFLKILKYKNSNGIPINAFLVQLSLALLFIITSSFEQVLMYAGVTLIITTTLTVISLFISRYYEPKLDRPYKVIGYPFIPLLYLLANVWILYFSFKEHTLESMVGICIIIGSVFLFWLLKRVGSFS
ncbi:MAG: APC family permease [Candidatus Neomarinimicrobiota bacterium]